MDLALLLPLGAVMLLAAAIAYSLAAHFSRVVHDQWLSDSVNSLAQAIVPGPGGARLELDDRARALFGWDAEDRTWFRLESPSRGTLGGSAEVPLHPAIADAFDPVGDTRIFDGRIGGERTRIARLSLPAARYGENLQLLVAETVRKRSRTAREIAVAVLIPQLVLSGLALLLLSRAVHRTVQPLRQLADQLNVQSHASLAPLPVTGAPVEVHPLIHALNDLLSRLENVITRKQELLATAAHDLRTPLAAALLHLEAVRPADGASAQSLDTAQIALRRAARAAQQVLSFAQAEANAVSPDSFATVDLCELARQIGAELAPTAMTRGHSLSLEVPREVVLARCNYDLLFSAVANLLDNAIKYTAPGGDIVVRVCDEGETVGIEVIDDGPGMAGSLRVAAGDERFVRGERSVRAGIDGAGLGLAIAREVALRHGGRLAIGPRASRRGTSAILWLEPAPA